MFNNWKRVEKVQDISEDENDLVKEIFKPVGVRTVLPTCRNCGNSDHTSERKVRRRNCPAWNKVCEICNKRGHSKNVCKSIQNSTEISSLSLGEIAALGYCLSRVSRQLKPINKVKVPHMLHDQIKWAVSRPRDQPYITVSVSVDTQSYRDQSIRPPSAYRHRVADMRALADTGCQAVVLDPTQLA